MTRGSAPPDPAAKIAAEVGDLGDVLIAFTGAVIGLGAGIAVVPGVSADSPWSVALAALGISAATWLLSLPLRWLADRTGGGVAFLLGLAVQIGIMLAALHYLPGMVVETWWDAVWVLLVAAIVISILGWLTAGDPAFAVSDIVRRGRRARNRRRGEVAPEREPGLLLVIFDGVAEPVLRHAIDAGHAPTIARWLSDGTYRLDTWWAQIPSTTPASTAGLLHGKADHIPAFRWWDESKGRLVVANHPWDAAAIEAELSDGEGLLAYDGAAVATAFSGDAATAQLVMSRVYGKAARKRREGGDYVRFFANPFVFPRALVLSIGEMVKEIWQARAARVRGVEPRIGRGGPYIALRGITNVWLRALGTTLVAEHMERGTPTIAVDFVDYDEIAHHAGPVRPESMRSLEGMDGVLRALATANEVAARDYRIVVVSDHGQTLGATFAQVTGTTLTELVTSLQGQPRPVRQGEAGHAAARDEEWGPLNALLGDALGSVRGRPVATGRAHRAGRGSASIVAENDDDAGPPRPGQPPKFAPDSVSVIASGNLGVVWFTGVAGRMQLADIQERWPALIPGLVQHEGIGVVVVDSPAGLVAIGKAGTQLLEAETEVDANGAAIADGASPLAIYGDAAAAARDLRRAGRLPHTGDLLVVSDVTPAGHVHAFETQVGSHGGIGGDQNRAMLLYPSSLHLSSHEPLVGADAVFRQLVAWQRELGLRP